MFMSSLNPSIKYMGLKIYKKSSGIFHWFFLDVFTMLLDIVYTIWRILNQTFETPLVTLTQCLLMNTLDFLVSLLNLPSL